MSERYEHLEKALCKELERLDKKYSADVEMTEQDAERADRLYHALKSAETYHAMHDAQEEMNGYSARGGNGRRGGYSYGPPNHPGYVYREADPGYSGHYPAPMDYRRTYPADWGRIY